jgi:SAM-dependent methyltransferase
VTSAEIRSCPGCLAGAGIAVGEVHGFAIRMCPECRTLFTARLPGAGEDKDYACFYAEGRNVAVPDFVLARLEETVASLAPYRSSLNRWLDIGCGTGTLLRAVANAGWDELGTEVAPAAAEAVRAAGFDVLVGGTGDLDLPAAGFDVVSMVEVIEHVPEPDDLLTAAGRLLRPGGALYLTTPHGRGLSARVLRAGWSLVTPPDHLQLFSIHGLRVALARAGLDVRSVATHGLNPYELVARLRAGHQDQGGHSHTETSYRLNESLSTTRKGLIFKRAANTALSGMRLGDTLKIMAERPVT